MPYKLNSGEELNEKCNETKECVICKKPCGDKVKRETSHYHKNCQRLHLNIFLKHLKAKKKEDKDEEIIKWKCTNCGTKFCPLHPRMKGCLGCCYEIKHVKRGGEK